MLRSYRTRWSVFNYDEIPPGYYDKVMREGAASQRYWHREKFRAVASKIQPGSRVADFGCGPGTFLDILGEESSTTRGIGFDASSGQVEFARRNIAPKHGGRMQFQLHDTGVPKLELESTSTDVVTIIEVVEHLHPFLSARLLSEARRVLKADGKLLITTPNYRSLWPIIEFLLERLSPVKYHEQHISKFTPSSFVKFIESCGFEVERLESLFVVAPFVAPISRRLAGWIQGLERRVLPLMGSLLVAEARPLADSVFQTQRG